VHVGAEGARYYKGEIKKMIIKSAEGLTTSVALVVAKRVQANHKMARNSINEAALNGKERGKEGRSGRTCNQAWETRSKTQGI